MKKTRWFPASVKPVRKGWYETECLCGRLHYWDGVLWFATGDYARDKFPYIAMDWRGLTKEVK